MNFVVIGNFTGNRHKTQSAFYSAILVGIKLIHKIVGSTSSWESDDTYYAHDVSISIILVRASTTATATTTASCHYDKSLGFGVCFVNSSIDL